MCSVEAGLFPDPLMWNDVVFKMAQCADEDLTVFERIKLTIEDHRKGFFY